MHFGKSQKCLLGCITITMILVLVYMSTNEQYRTIPGQDTVLDFLFFNITSPTSAPNAFQSPTRGEHNIIFLETSCAVNETEYTDLELKLNTQQACAIESAANTNPNATIYLFYTCPITSASLTRSSQLVRRVLQNYPNVRIWHQSMASFFEGTPLEEFYKKGQMKTSDYPKSHASDVLRFLVLWKFGGIYLDLDFIVLRELSTLGPNFAGIECCGYVASGALGFAVEGVGKRIADVCVEELRTNFQGKIFNHNGPALITRVLREQCGFNKTELMTIEACGGFAVLPPTAFYPIIYNWRLFYNESLSDDTMKQIKKGHAVHLWNTLMRWEGGQKSLRRAGSRQPLVLLQQEFCPVVCEVADQRETTSTVGSTARPPRPPTEAGFEAGATSA